MRNEESLIEVYRIDGIVKTFKDWESDLEYLKGVHSKAERDMEDVRNRFGIYLEYSPKFVKAEKKARDEYEHLLYMFNRKGKDVELFEKAFCEERGIRLETNNIVPYYCYGEAGYDFDDMIRAWNERELAA